MKVSIITPTYNSEEFIKDTLESIKNQTYPQIEHIICDNMSTDRTKEICMGYDNIFIQKSDKSMYEALNTGILRSSGDLLCFLNSDDLYPENETIEKVVDCFNHDNATQVVYGKCRRVDKNLKYLYSHNPRKILTFEFAKKRIFIVSHPAVFVKRSVFEKHGLYDLNLKYMADCEYWLRLLHANVKFNYFNETLAVFRRHSRNLSLSNNALSEIRYIADKYQYKNTPVKVRLYLLYDNKFNFEYIKFLIKKYMINGMKNLRKLVYGIKEIFSLVE